MNRYNCNHQYRWLTLEEKKELIKKKKIKKRIGLSPAECRICGIITWNT